MTFEHSSMKTFSSPDTKNPAAADLALGLPRGTVATICQSAFPGNSKSDAALMFAVVSDGTLFALTKVGGTAPSSVSELLDFWQALAAHCAKGQPEISAFARSFLASKVADQLSEETAAGNNPPKKRRL